jgi:adenine/guanine/hypoxanthine permease
MMVTKLYTICDNYFKISERNTSIASEIRAGTVSFLTLSYLLLVNPHIMNQAGVDQNDAIFATAISAAISCFIIGIFGNLPFGLAPGLGLSAYLTFGLVQTGLCTLSEALTACWWSGILVFIISLTGLSALLMRTVPHAIKLAIVVGMGLLIAMIGMVSIDLIVANPKTLVELGNIFGSTDIQLSLVGILLVASLLYHNVKGAILIGITFLTLVAWIMNQSWPTTIFELPKYHANDYWLPFVIFDYERISVFGPAIGAFVLICIFDISGVMFGLATLGNIIHPTTGEISGSLWAFIASAVGTMIAAWTGSTPIIVCVECASGVREGGRTGLTAIVIGLYFVLSIFLAPLFSAVPEIATAPVLVMVGVMMMGESAKIPWENMNDALPAFLTIILMPLTYSITNGMIFGLATSVAFYFTTGQFLSDAKTLHRKLRYVSSVTDESDALIADDNDVSVQNGNDTSNYGTV